MEENSQDITSETQGEQPPYDTPLSPNTSSLLDTPSPTPAPRPHHAPEVSSSSLSSKRKIDFSSHQEPIQESDAEHVSAESSSIFTFTSSNQEGPSIEYGSQPGPPRFQGEQLTSDNYNDPIQHDHTNTKNEDQDEYYDDEDEGDEFEYDGNDEDIEILDSDGYNYGDPYRFLSIIEQKNRKPKEEDWSWGAEAFGADSFDHRSQHQHDLKQDKTNQSDPLSPPQAALPPQPVPHPLSQPDTSRKYQIQHDIEQIKNERFTKQDMELEDQTVAPKASRVVTYQKNDRLFRENLPKISGRDNDQDELDLGVDDEGQPLPTKGALKKASTQRRHVPKQVSQKWLQSKAQKPSISQLWFPEMEKGILPTERFYCTPDTEPRPTPSNTDTLFIRQYMHYKYRFTNI
eukprot:gb/GECH01011997.1/.p1 GENE.gb/GECH01011997.1/~~gb/GECH01011997.1/.p1  ORF type:complete len:402 (+),score=76.70 gb/GECH01011997.1/:1-1206(+)